ncbi:hypothetical protein V7128_01575 [Neobacillus vireti]|uniref:hypothetical protein n=1 Tax=Neobacillus vireti TaxID=220686 RepID=UPI002FFFE66C
MEILKLPYELYKYYKTCTKDNENITRDQAARKLTRNVMLADEMPPRNDLDKEKGNKMYHFGNLHIVTRQGTIIHLMNHQSKRKWNKDEQRYQELNKELGII